MRVFLGVSVALLVVWFLGQLVGFLIGLGWARCRSRRVFRRRLRRNGLPADVVDEIGRRYHRPGLLRAMLRSDRS